METKKLTINEQFLTLEQAKELQKLGIDFSCAIYCFGKRIKDGRGNKMLRQKSFLCPSGNHGVRSVLLEQYEFIPTLSVAEMISILPKKLTKGKEDYYPEIYILEKGYGIQYINLYKGVMLEGAIDTMASLLRDALFEMIKLLKQNKFI